MFKLFVLAALFAVAAARPGYLGGSSVAYSAPVHTTFVQEPTYAHVGSVIKSIPTAVSHQSISQVHSSAHYVQPVVAPVLKTYSAPVYNTYAPVKTISSPLAHSYGAAPFVNSAYTSYEASPVLKTYDSYAPSYDGSYDGSYGASYGGHVYGGAPYGSHAHGVESYGSHGGAAW